MQVIHFVVHCSATPLAGRSVSRACRLADAQFSSKMWEASMHTYFKEKKIASRHHQRNLCGLCHVCTQEVKRVATDASNACSEVECKTHARTSAHVSGPTSRAVIQPVWQKDAGRGEGVRVALLAAARCLNLVRLEVRKVSAPHGHTFG